MIHPAPKPAKREKKQPRPLKRTALKSRTTPIKKSGETKAKKVVRQKAFYASATWRRLKKAAKERAGHRCQYAYFGKGDPFLEVVDGELRWVEITRCEETERLEVHHKTNARFGGDERPEDLVCLCKTHHDMLERLHHPTRQARRRVVARA